MNKNSANDYDRTEEIQKWQHFYGLDEYDPTDEQPTEQ